MSEDEVVEAVRNLTEGFGTDVTIDAVGIQPTWRQAFYSRDHAGRMVMVGVPNLTDHVDIPAIDLYGRGVPSSRRGTVIASRSATSRPTSPCTAMGSSRWTSSFRSALRLTTSRKPSPP